jgi:hypothetical protein
MEAAMPEYTCSTCGAHHDEVPLCFIARAPVYVATIAPEERSDRVSLSSDQCVIDGKHFFILGNLDLRIHGVDSPFRWSLWSSLSEKNFERAHELWSTPGRENEPGYFGWLSTSVPGYENTVSLKVGVHTQPVGIRPRIEVLEQDHSLYRDYVDGISWDRACALSHAALPEGTAF